MSTSIAIALAVFALFILPKMIVVISEGSVLMLFALGKFQKAYPPGVHLGWFDVKDKVKISLGTIGKVTSDSTFEVRGYQIPVAFVERAEVGSRVRVLRIVGIQPVVTREGVPAAHRIVCDKCGHEMSVEV